MLNSRRSQPIPLDFEYALHKFNLPLSSLKPHLKPPIPASKTQLQLEALPAELEDARKQRDKIVAKLLGDELDGEAERRAQPYIPKKFIPFPSQHTYKWTPPDVPVQMDRRKIREEAAKVSRSAEEALRRFVKVAKSGKEKDLKNAASKDPKTRETHELWEKVMGDLADLQPNSSHGRNDDEDQSIVVNSESKYFRKGVLTKKATIPDLRLSA
jgi:transcription initiation factor TFIID subunit 8